MGFAVNTARFVFDLHYLCSHCGVLPKNFDKPSIADLGKEMQKSYNFLMKKGVFPLTALL